MTVMKKDKFQKMDTISKILDGTGIILTAISFSEPVKKNKTINTAIAIAGGACSMASFVNYMLSLEQYGLETEIDEGEIFARMMWNVVVLPVVNTLSFANAIKENNKNH